MTIVKSRKELTSLSQLETSENTTFIIQNAVRAAAGVETISIASGVSLVFDGGMIAGALVTRNNKQIEQPLKLVGNFTSVEAPIAQIFGDTVSAKGYWHIDRAYPRWFDAVVGTQSYDTANPHDCSVAINKAVEMKMSGEVFLPTGVYLVSHTIFLRHGINLIGDSATRTKIDEKNAPDSDMVNKWGRASFIVPSYWKYEDVNTGEVRELPPDFSKYSIDGVVRPVMLAINMEDAPSANAHIPFAHPDGSIDYIYFINVNKDMMTDDVKAENCADIAQGTICCLVAGGFSFRHIVWENFCRAIKWTREYNDAKTIYRCIMQNDFKPKVMEKISEKQELPYLIDMVGCGDAAIIEGNHIDKGERDGKRLYKALSMRDCFGGTIRANIIHSDIDIKHCTTLEFADNHCELGMQMNIRWSSIRICNNYLEKGLVPNIVIHAMDGASEENGTFGDVELSGNKFLCYNTDGRTPIAEICEYDMLLKTRKGVAPHNIEMSRNSRVTVNADGLSMQPTGIMLATQNVDKDGIEEDVQPFTAFNGHSYFLSDRAVIRRGLELEQRRNFKAIPHICIEAWPSSNIEKASTAQAAKAQVAAASKDTTFPYGFYAYAVMDDKRWLSSELFRLDFKGRASYVCDKTDKNGNTTKVPCGNVYRLRWKGSQLPCIVRLVRKETVLLGMTEYRIAEVPVCGATFLYDNSVSVNGHLWRTPAASELAKIESDITSYNSIPASLHPEFVSAAPGLSAIEFRDDNVTCQAPALPTEGSWEQGDIVFNTTAPTQENPQPGFWIKGSNGWTER